LHHLSSIKSLDGLRGLAALIVVVSHFSFVVSRFAHGELKGAGHAGLMIFFVLSGFLMGHLYLDTPRPGKACRSSWCAAGHGSCHFMLLSSWPVLLGR